MHRKMSYGSPKGMVGRGDWQRRDSMVFLKEYAIGVEKSLLVRSLFESDGSSSLPHLSNSQSFVQFISALRSPISVAMQPGSSLSSSSPKPSFPSTLYAPSFSHAVKDPIDRDIPVLPSHRLVVLEGLYCNLSDSPWDQGARLFDERWLVDVPREVARERLRVRHVVTGVAKDEEEALWRGQSSNPALWHPFLF